MCGFSAIINLDNSQPLNSDLKRMNDIIYHRGPDDEGFYFGKNFGFGFRRLSIIDLSEGGHQPMQDVNENVLIFNGEIYNYLELKAELTKSGYSFNSKSDTEVILAAYAHWGQDCVDHFNGMWAFALFDKKQDILFCSRDRFGIKPFNYTATKNNFLIGSEIKQFMSVKEFEAKLDHTVAFDFLVNSFLNINENTFFENVKVLQAGHNLIYDLKTHKFEIKKYYDINDIALNKNITSNEAKNSFYNYFEESIKLRMRSDVAVGSLLSGGLDSSAIVCMIRQLNYDIKTISSCFKDPRYDEQEFIDIVSEHTHFTSLKVFPEMDVLLKEKTLEKIIYHQDQPILSTSHFSEFKVFEKAAHENLTVIMDGQGSDEFMAGYLDYNTFFTSLLSKMRFKLLFKELNNYRKKHDLGISKMYLSFALFYTKHIFSKVKTNKKGNNKVPGFFDKEWKNDKIRSSSANTKNFTFSDIKDISEHYINKTSLPYQLHSEDRNSMAHSIESRLPFLDFDLIDFLLSVPDDVKIKDGETKSILRLGLNSTLPAKIRNRQKKMGFVAPDEQWFRKNHAAIRSELEKNLPLLKGIINTNILNDFDDVIKRSKAYDQVYFRVLSFGLWVKIFNIKIEK